ncbi:MAG TPA: hypothetical protein VIS96_13625 [Terrimicrobiaceae bacterium]
MKQIAVMAGLLIAPFLIAKAVGADGYWAGRLGLALVFLFAAIGHFIKTDAMAGMLPPSLPKRRALIQISGFFEAAIAVSLLAWPKSPLVGFVIIAFLVAIFPSNIYAAMRRIDFGGHSAGPRYLLVRAPLQLLLIFWTYWFVLRGSA